MRTRRAAPFTVYSTPLEMVRADDPRPAGPSC